MKTTRFMALLFVVLGLSSFYGASIFGRSAVEVTLDNKSNEDLSVDVHYSMGLTTSIFCPYDQTYKIKAGEHKKVGEDGYLCGIQEIIINDETGKNLLAYIRRSQLLSCPQIWEISGVKGHLVLKRPAEPCPKIP
jgi:hypothetical protein